MKKEKYLQAKTIVDQITEIKHEMGFITKYTTQGEYIDAIRHILKEDKNFVQSLKNLCESFIQDQQKLIDQLEKDLEKL